MYKLFILKKVNVYVNFSAGNASKPK